MKKIFIAIVTLASFAACKSNKTDLETTKAVVLVDTTGMYKSNVLTDTGSMIVTQPVNRQQVSSNAGNTNASNTTTRKRTTSPTRRTTRYSNSNVNSGSNQTTSSGQTTAPRRRGWSKAAKGATIGGVGGAVTGAIISKNKVKGAVIGGVLGAAGGYIIGRDKDKKDGRY